MSGNIVIAHLAECESDALYLSKRNSDLKKSRLCQIPSDKESEIFFFTKLL